MQRRPAKESRIVTKKKGRGWRRGDPTPTAERTGTRGVEKKDAALLAASRILLRSRPFEPAFSSTEARLRLPMVNGRRIADKRRQGPLRSKNCTCTCRQLKGAHGLCTLGKHFNDKRAVIGTPLPAHGKAANQESRESRHRKQPRAFQNLKGTRGYK